jgi:hypothetical protein
LGALRWVYDVQYRLWPTLALAQASNLGIPMGLLQPNHHDAFLSYAHDDDILTDGQIHQIRALLQERFEAKMRQKVSQVSPADIFMDKTGLPKNGDLTSELEKAVSTSILLFIFVGNSYPRSDWCGKELQFFARQFGDDKVRAVERTFIIVFEKSAVEELKERLRSNIDGAIYVEMFDKIDGTPLPLFMEHEVLGVVLNPRFTKLLRQIIDTMTIRAISLVQSS